MARNSLDAALKRLVPAINQYEAVLKAIDSQDGDIPADQWSQLVNMASGLVTLTDRVQVEVVNAGSLADAIIAQNGGGSVVAFATQAAAIDTAAKAFHQKWAAIRAATPLAYSAQIRADLSGNPTDAFLPLTGADASSVRDLPELTALISALAA